MRETSTQSSDPADRQGRAPFFDELVASGRFCRDTSLGAIFHRGSVSLREITDGDSLHVCIDPNDKVSVHVDRFSPVAGGCPDGSCRYSLGAVIAHLIAHVSSQARRLVRGARGQHRCRLKCELVEVPDVEAAAAVEGVLAAAREPDCAEATGTTTAAG